MIKYLNDGEIKLMRRGLFKTLVYKKFSMCNLGKFNNMDISIEKAAKIYKWIKLLSENLVPNISELMLNYFLKYNYIDQEIYNKIVLYYHESNELEDEDLYYEYWQEREDSMIAFIKSICNKNSLVYDIDYTKRIFEGNDINKEIFEGIKKYLRSAEENSNPNYYDDMSQEELEEEYFSSFETDSLILGIKDFVLSEEAYQLLHDLNCYDYTIILAPVFMENGNTYFEFSYTSLENIDYTFFILFILAIKKLI